MTKNCWSWTKKSHCSHTYSCYIYCPRVGHRKKLFT